MNKILKAKFFTLFFIILIYNITALSQVQDAGSWTGLNAEIKISNNLRASVEQQVRLIDNISSFDKTFTDLGFTIRFSRNLRLSANYRYIFENIGLNNQRVYFSLLFRKRILDRTRLSYRIRYQNQFDKLLNENRYLRNKLRLNYNIRKSKLDPYLAVELYYHFNNYIVYKNEEVLVYHEFNKYRIQFGWNINLRNNRSMDIFYIYQKEFNVNNPEIDNIFGIIYNFRL
ncbi:DUF2490 domain-containing protein [Bacteroidales bacterium AH-315-N07]|nr:DUF2490 domain-containing protein [Bacteroidales bacterium AH-315-N07]